MIGIETLRQLVASGMNAEQILAIGEALVVDAQPKDRTAAERQARHREKVKAERDSITRDVTRDTVTETLPPLAPPNVSPGPLSNTPPIPPQPTKDLKRASRLLESWKPDGLTGKAADMVRRWNPGEIEREIAKFRNYWMGKAGKDACKIDWQRTWINWLIAADERKPRNGQSPYSSLGKSAQAFAMFDHADDRPLGS